MGKGGYNGGSTIYTGRDMTGGKEWTKDEYKEFLAENRARADKAAKRLQRKK